MKLKQLIIILISFGIISCSTIDSKTGERKDPLEKFNRTMWDFNYKVVDPYILQPVGKAWQIVPKPVRKGLVNVVNTTDEPIYMVNSALQGKFKNAFIHFDRFWINAIFGLGGIIDIAGRTEGLKTDESDHFGHTLGKYGVKSGAFVMLPFYGPATPRQELGNIADLQYPIMSLLSWPLTLTKAGIKILDATEEMDKKRDFLKTSQDPYVLVREAYLQNLDKRTNQNKQVLEEKLDEKTLNDID